MEKKIGIACDHAGYEMKEFLIGYLGAKGYDVYDFGTDSPEAVDYADFAHPLAEAIEKGEFEHGIALCGSGEGMAITLNKHQRIRAGLVWRKEIAELVKKHNNANVIVLPARFITSGIELASLRHSLRNGCGRKAPTTAPCGEIPRRKAGYSFAPARDRRTIRKEPSRCPTSRHKRRPPSTNSL